MGVGTLQQIWVRGEVTKFAVILCGKSDVCGVRNLAAKMVTGKKCCTGNKEAVVADLMLQSQPFHIYRTNTNK